MVELILCLVSLHLLLKKKILILLQNALSTTLFILIDWVRKVEWCWMRTILVSLHNSLTVLFHFTALHSCVLWLFSPSLLSGDTLINTKIHSVLSIHSSTLSSVKAYFLGLLITSSRTTTPPNLKYSLYSFFSSSYSSSLFFLFLVNVKCFFHKALFLNRFNTI